MARAAGGRVIATEPVAAAPSAGAPPHDVPAVSLRGLTKGFAVRRRWVDALRHPRRRERAVVVRDVTVDVMPGEFFGLLGPNGAGKTTLLKMLATLVVPDEGAALVCGHDVRRDPAAVRRLLTPVIADDRSLHWRLDATENLRLFAALADVPRHAIGGRVTDVLRSVGLDDAGTKLVGTFSSGMKQRLLIGRALLARPRVLLLDEPTRSLDPISARAFRRFLREEIVGRQGCAILLATHNAEEAFELCDRVGVLHRGALLAVGKPATLMREMADERYDLWTTAPRHAAIEALSRAADTGGGATAPLAHHLVVSETEDGWTRVQMEVPGGMAQAARVIDLLTCAGVPVGRFERVGLSLADLIERIVARDGTHA